MEQLLTLVNLNQVFLYSCQTASGKHWMKWESFIDQWILRNNVAMDIPTLSCVPLYEPFNAGEGVDEAGFRCSPA